MKWLKTFGGIIGILISYVAVRSRLGYRVTSDERLVAQDIMHVVAGNGLDYVTYTAGNGFTTLKGMMFQVIGLTYLDHQLLSPILGVVLLSMMALSLLSIYRRSGGVLTPAVVLIVFGSMLVFASFFNSITETTHKSYTYLLVLVSYFLLTAVHIHTRQTKQLCWRLWILFLVVASTVSVFNHIWGLVFIGAGAVTVLLNRSLLRRPAAVLPVGIPFILPLWFPTIELNRSYISQFTLALVELLSGRIPSREGGEVGSGTGDVAAWPIVDLGIVTFSSWLIWTSGIFFIALCSMLGFCYLVLTTVRQRRIPTFGILYFGIAPALGMFVLLLLMLGDLSTARRLIAIPGMIGMLVFLLVLRRDSLDPNMGRVRSMQILAGAFILFTVAAVPRMWLDGTISPYNAYASAPEIAQMSWLFDLSRGPSCVGVNDTTGFVRLTKLREPDGFLPGISSNFDSSGVVYSSGSTTEIHLTDCD